MSESPSFTFDRIVRVALVVAVLAFAYMSVIDKLTHDWWFDENYSHGLLIPFVVGLILWNERKELRSTCGAPSVWLGTAIVISSVVMLAGGTLGAELFTQRLSLLLILSGVTVFFFGKRILSRLTVPFVLFFLAIPIPQIVFNRIAFPLQIWASQMAVWGIRFFEIPVTRLGNVIDILPKGSTQTISLEVVEACSGIRSLSTLITLALILVYFTRQDGDRRSWNFGLGTSDAWRAVILMLLAVPIAVVTNAARVSATGILTYYYGKPASESTVHEVSGWLVYISALAILISANFLIKKAIKPQESVSADTLVVESVFRRSAPLLPIVVLIFGSGLAINWFVHRGEVPVPRSELVNLPQTLGDWRQKGSDFKFESDVESVLGATDYTMREYSLPDGRIANLYVGYYASQRTGATYHSPQNCLPGSGWMMGDRHTIDIRTSDGRTFTANLYLIESGVYREIMVYWYQGRGRIEASEYNDKVNTVWDSITRRRTDGAMVRVMTNVGSDESAAKKAVADLAARLEEQLDPFVPE